MERYRIGRMVLLQKLRKMRFLDAASQDALLSVGGERGVRLVMGGRLHERDPDHARQSKEVLTIRRASKAKREATDGPGPTAEVDRAIAKIDEGRKDADLLSGMRGPFDMPESGQLRLVVADAIALCLDSDPKGASAWTPLRLAIIEPTESIEDFEASPAA